MERGMRNWCCDLPEYDSDNSFFQCQKLSAFNDVATYYVLWSHGSKWDFWGSSVIRARHFHFPSFFLKTFTKCLTNPKVVWYNKIVLAERQSCLQIERLRQVLGSKVRCYLYTYLYTYRSRKCTTGNSHYMLENGWIPYNMTLGDMRWYTIFNTHNPKVVGSNPAPATTFLAKDNLNP